MTFLKNLQKSKITFCLALAVVGWVVFDVFCKNDVSFEKNKPSLQEAKEDSFTAADLQVQTKQDLMNRNQSFSDFQKKLDTNIDSKDEGRFYDSKKSKKNSKSQSFATQRQVAEVLYPKLNASIESSIYKIKKIKITWKPLAEVSSYQVEILNEKRRPLGHFRTSETSMLINLEADRTYLLRVVSADSRTLASTEKNKGQYHVFHVHSNATTQSGLIDEPALFYFRGRVGLSPSQYSGVNPTLNQRIEQKLVTQDLGLEFGYWFPRSHWGALVQSKFSQLSTDSGVSEWLLNYSFLVGYKRSFLKNSKTRQWFGLNWRETPEVTVHLNSYSINGSRDLGLYYKMEHWQELSNIFALQIFASYHYGGLGKGQTQAQGLDNQSYEIGVGLAYKPSVLWRLGASYSYQVDSRNYKNQQGQTHSQRLEGHYLNFFVEFGFNRDQSPPFSRPVSAKLESN